MRQTGHRPGWGGRPVVYSSQCRRRSAFNRDGVILTVVKCVSFGTCWSLDIPHPNAVSMTVTAASSVSLLILLLNRQACRPTCPLRRRRETTTYTLRKHLVSLWARSTRIPTTHLPPTSATALPISLKQRTYPSPDAITARMIAAVPNPMPAPSGPHLSGRLAAPRNDLSNVGPHHTEVRRRNRSSPGRPDQGPEAPSRRSPRST